MHNRNGNALARFTGGRQSVGNYAIVEDEQPAGDGKLLGLVLSDPTPAGLGPQTLPELMGSVRPVSDGSYYRDGNRLLNGAHSAKDGGVERVIMDYPYVGTAEAMRHTVYQLGSLGVHSDRAVSGTVSGTTATARYEADVELSLGFVLEWGVELQTSQPFALSIATSGWKIANQYMVTGNGSNSQQSVDRNITLWTCDGSNGGRIFVPWAQRKTPSMSIAMPAIAVTPTDNETPPIGNGLIQVTNIPSALAASFSMRTRLLTAWSLGLAEFADLIGLFDGVQKSRKVCP